MHDTQVVPTLMNKYECLTTKYTLNKIRSKNYNTDFIHLRQNFEVTLTVYKIIQT